MKKRESRAASCGENKVVKIAYIGGGSCAWARGLMTDLAKCPHITGELALYDIDYAGAAINARLARQIFSHPEAVTAFRVYPVRKLADALKGADFVVISIEPGPTQMRYADLEIPKKYGILQPVGDTVGPGGLMRALRTIPTYVGFADAIMKHCPDAWVINYTNPMTLCVATLYAAQPKIKAFGCCHEVFGTQSRLAGLVEKWFKVPRPARQEIVLDIAGVNHFTHSTAAAWNGQDLFPRLKKMIAEKGFFADRTARSRARIRKGNVFGSEGLVAMDLLARFGSLGSAGDRHLVEFVPWYLTSEKDLHRWGVVLTPFSKRIEIYRGKMRNRAKPLPPGSLHGTGEEGVKQMVALLGMEPLDTNVNLPNCGQIADLPAGAVVETYSQFRRDSAKPITARPLPQAVNSLVRKIVDVQQLTLTGALAKDKHLTFQALLLDPLVNIPTDRAWKMFNEMLDYTKPMLPGWKI
ncbi:MAG: alpha-galactosidase [Planctomycetes bacterium]|nr:alpha-galactosidase [Planctomycetota bacterium]